tara:strand:+ start:71 stop:295 length:225 start_codon:yes stop_codon:yes gene_type:complete
MRIIKNISLQGLQIPFQAGAEVKYVFLTPRKQVEVPSSWASAVAENLAHRRMVKIFNTPDPAPAPVSPKKRVRN